MHIWIWISDCKKQLQVTSLLFIVLNSNNIGDNSIAEEIKRNGSTPTIHSSVKMQAILSHHSSGLLVSKLFFWNDIPVLK